MHRFQADNLTFGGMKDIAFYLGVGALFTHELDAVANHEWRVLPLIRALPDELGMKVFLIAHVPLFAFVIAGIASPSRRFSNIARLTISSFLVLHGVLHYLFTNQPGYEFSSTLSNLLIFGGAGCGAIYLALFAWKRQGNAI